MYTYLALGDSYTIGEQVPVYENFPYQTVQLLRKAGISFHAPEIVAKTGFTTDELILQMATTQLLHKYDLVTLLIGVNNQYRGRTVDDFESELETLVKKAIQFAGGDANHVVMLSIPDWGVTPFAKEKNAADIAFAIDAYNHICEEIAKKFSIHFINITTAQRVHGHDENYLASDGLHPSGKEYAVWADALSKLVQQLFS